MRVAVVGAGVYGCAAAVELARHGHQVDLYDRHRDLLHGATRGNQARLHSGYHYPRSRLTALACKADAKVFAARFPGAVNRRNSHHYAIATEGSLTSPDQYRMFCRHLDAGAVERPVPSWLSGVAAYVAAPEAIINILALRERLRVELRKAGVRWHRDQRVDPDRLDHDLVVMASYGHGWPQPLRWEVCEVAVLGGTHNYGFASIVVLDGPFCSLDPLATRGGHTLYDVVHSVHAANIGHTPEIPDHLTDLVDQGLVRTPHTRVADMLATAHRFLPRLTGETTYVGSMFSVRAVLPRVDATDERPTLIRQDGRMLWVLSGKLDGAATAAARVLSRVQMVAA